MMFMLFCTQKLQSCFALPQVSVRTIAVVPPLTYRFFKHILPRSTYYSALKIDATQSSKTVVLKCHSTRCHTTDETSLTSSTSGYFYVFLCLIITFKH